MLLSNTLVSLRSCCFPSILELCPSKLDVKMLHLSYHNQTGRFCIFCVCLSLHPLLCLLPDCPSLTHAPFIHEDTSHLLTQLNPSLVDSVFVAYSCLLFCFSRFVLCIWVFSLHVICAPHACLVALSPMELKLVIVVITMSVLGTKHWSPARATTTLNPWALSPVPAYSLVNHIFLRLNHEVAISFLP